MCYDTKTYIASKSVMRATKHPIEVLMVINNNDRVLMAIMRRILMLVLHLLFLTSRRY